MPFIYKYQVDGAGNYVLDGGNKVILESYEYGEGAGLDWRRIASSTKKPPYVRSFQVRKFNNGDTWVLIINQKQLVGIYPSQDAALQILNGLFTRVSANDEAAREVMSHQLSKGRSSVDPAFNNLTLARSGDDLVITLSLINTTDPAIATPIVTWDDYTNPGSPGQKTTVGSVTEPEGGTQIFTIVGGWNTAVENNYIQAFLEDSGVGVSASSNVILKDEVDPSGTLSVLIQNLAGDGPPEATTDGITYTGAAYATPSWTVEDWPVGVTPSYSYAWAYEVDGGGLVSVGGGGSTLDLALVPYGATITVGAVATAYVNGKIVTSASPAPQVAVAVSGPVGIDVVDIRLFTDAGRTNNVTNNPPGDTSLYAYAYSNVNDPDSSPISGDVAFTYTSGITPGTGFAGDIAETTIDGGVSYTTAGDANAMVWWSETPLQLAGADYGDFTQVAVVADHYNGIEKVGFIADDGVEVFVTTPEVTADGLTQYRATVDMSGKSAGDTVEVRAIAYPNHGVTRVLQGEIPFDTSVDDTSKMCNLGMKITKIGAIQTTNVTTGTSLRAALNALGDITASTDQHRLVFADAAVLAGAESNASLMHEYIPVIIEGSLPNRGVLITDNVLNNLGPFNKGSYHFKNITWDGSSVVMRPSASSNRQIYISVDDCTITDLSAEVPEGTTWLDSDGVSVNLVGNNVANDKSLGKLTWAGAVADGRDTVSAVTSNADDHRGIWVENSTFGMDTGDAVKWIKNCESVNTLADTFHGGCMLNLDVISASRGYNQTFPLKQDVLNFVSGKSFPAGAKVVGLVGTQWKVLSNNTGSPLATTNFSISDGWTANIHPHADGWQGRAARDGRTVWENMWFEGLTTDTDSVVQPWFSREAEIFQDCMFKRWEINNTAQFDADQLAQIYVHMHHWIMDDCVWWPNGGSSGDLRIVWDDLGIRGWGNTVGGQNVACKYAKWKNSSVKGLIDEDWTPVSATFQDWVDQINSGAGSFVGWDLDVDAFTLANSYIYSDAPQAPFNVSATAGAGSAKEGETASLSVSYEGTEPITLTYSWTKDGVPVAGEDSATYPKTGTIPTGDVGAVLVGTVTATNAYGSANDSHDFGAIADINAGDWDTFADGIWGTPSATNDPADSQELTASVNYLTTASGGFHGWYRDGTEPASRYWNTLGGDTPPPYIAVWNETDGVWHGWSGHGTLTNIANETIRWDDAGANLWTFGHEGDVIVIVYLSQAPTNFAGWRNYDGPLPVAPTDWDDAPVTYFHSTAGTVGYIFNTAGWDATGTNGGDIPPETTTTSGGNARMGNTVSGGWDGGVVNTLYPHVYVWTAADGWQKVTQTSTSQFRSSLDFDSTTVTYTGNPDFAFAFYTTDQGDPAGWRDYDGPTS